MQKDDDVGKVAQATPIVICLSFLNHPRQQSHFHVAKALELFLSNMVNEACKVTLARNAKRVEPYHL